MERNVYYVKLGSSLDDTHKIPIEKDWQLKNYGFNDAQAWIKEGHGVGVRLSGDLGVIDIDGEVDKDLIISLYKAGGFICKTLRGYHVFCNNKDLGSFGLRPGKYRLKNGTAVEIYNGESTRQVVLPVEGTPRYKLGGRFVKGLTFADADKFFKSISQKDTREVIQIVKDNLLIIDGDIKGKLNSVFGDWIKIDPEVIIAKMRNAQPGERHNLFLSISVVAFARGLDKNEIFVEKLFSAAREAWGGEYNEREIKNIWETRDNEVARELAEIYQKRVARGQRGRPRKKDIGEIYEEIFGDDEVGWAVLNNEYYILHNGFAVSEKFFIIYLAKLGFFLSENESNKLFLYAISINNSNYDAIVLSNFVIQIGNALAVAARVGNDVGILVRNEDLTFNFLPPGAIEGVYIKFGEGYRDFTKYYYEGNYIKYADEFLQVISLMLNKENKAYGCMLANIVCGTARGGVIINGVAGAGKSTVNLFLQYVAQGDGFFVNMGDKRDMVAALTNTRLIGIDESETLDDALQENLKSLISYGRLSQRALYTNNALATFNSEASVIFSAVEIKRLQPDLLRRCLQININKKNEVKVPENILLQAFKLQSEKYLLGAMYLASLTNLKQELDLIELLSGNIDLNNNLPEYLRDVSKLDLAKTYYETCRRVALPDEMVKEAWFEMRGGVHEMALENAWDAIIEKIETDSDFRAKMAEGLTASEIADKLDVGLEEKKSFTLKISKNALKIAPILIEIGYTLEIAKADSVASRKKVKKFIVKKKSFNGGIKYEDFKDLNLINLQIKEEEAF